MGEREGKPELTALEESWLANVNARRALELAFAEAMRGNYKGAHLLFEAAQAFHPGVGMFGKEALLPPRSAGFDLNRSTLEEVILALERPQAWTEEIDQSYFWTPEWQADEKEADKEWQLHLRGKLQLPSFSSIKDLGPQNDNQSNQ